jgi:hypothetical protein
MRQKFSGVTPGAGLLTLLGLAGLLLALHVGRPAPSSSRRRRMASPRRDRNLPAV